MLVWKNLLPRKEEFSLSDMILIASIIYNFSKRGDWLFIKNNSKLFLKNRTILKKWNFDSLEDRRVLEEKKTQWIYTMKKREEQVSMIQFSSWNNIGNIINELNDRKQQTLKVCIHLAAHSNFFLASSAQRV